MPGVFGRLPRAAPDLTASIVALVREAQAQTDQNLVDAWKNGGKVEGKGVDDDRLLAHMKSRRDQLDPDDPAWDEWNSNYMQYDFAINESKMALKNDQGKISDGQMAAFYRKWAGREDVQKDSEFYRSLLSRAAKWNASAKARSSGNSAQAAAESHQRWVNGYYKDHVQGSETANGYLLLIAKTYQAAPPGAQSLDDINPNSEGYRRFLDVIDDGKADDPNVQGLIDEMTREVQKTNPNFSWSQSNINDLMDRGDAGLKRLKSEATTDSERNDWAKRREALRYEKTRIRQAAANERIQVAADTYADDLDDCDGNPYCARNAAKKLRDKLQGEVKNVVAGAPGGVNVTGTTQDTKTASALIGTIRQLDDHIAGKDVKVPSAAVLGAGGSSDPDDYTIFDAAAGNDSARGVFGTTLNGVKGDADKLDRGGWMVTEPKTTQDGTPILDGQGHPQYVHRVYDANTPTPDGYIPVPGVAMATDNTRMGPMAGPEGMGGPVTVTPTVYVAPTTPSVQYIGPDGNTLSPNAAKEVKLFDGQTPAEAPWVELRGVKGPDGKARTLYRTGDGTPGNEYLFHDQPPVAVTTKPNAAGQFSVPVTVVPGEKGAVTLRGDVTPLVAEARLQRDKLASGNYVLGTYTSPGATGTAQALADLYARPANRAGEREVTANQFLRQFQRSIEALPVGSTRPDGTFVPNPDRAAMQRDFGQLSQTADLYKQGKTKSTLGDAYERANDKTEQVSGYLDSLNKAGFTADKYGQGEVDRRVALLTGIDDADQRLATRAAQFTTVSGVGKGGVGYHGPGWGGALTSIRKEQEALANQKKDVFNPTISVSNIKVPGMPTQMNVPQAPVMLGVGGYMGGWSPTAFPAPQTTVPKPPPTAALPPGHTPPTPKTTTPKTTTPKTTTPKPTGPAAGPNANRNPGEIIAANTPKPKKPVQVAPVYSGRVR